MGDKTGFLRPSHIWRPHIIYQLINEDTFLSSNTERVLQFKAATLPPPLLAQYNLYTNINEVIKHFLNFAISRRTSSDLTTSAKL